MHSMLGSESTGIACMGSLSYAAADIVVREDLAAAHARAWQRLASPGTWFRAERRLAIAAETRAARVCAYCGECKAALSPYAVEGSHRAATDLPGDLVEVVHRVATDPGRLTRAWFDRARESGIGDAEFVETIGIVATTVAIDFFCRAIGVRPHPLPEPEPGEPPRERPAGARPGPAWVPMLAPEDRTADESCLDNVYVSPDPTFVRRALSLVPREASGLFDMVDAQYLPGRLIPEVASRHRAIDRAQMELIAGRVSAVNGCFY